MSSGGSMSSCQSSVQKIYKNVIEEVISNVKESFFDEGIDESVLQELKSVWEAKLAASKAMENGTTSASHHHSDHSSGNSQQFIPHVSAQPGMRYQLPPAAVNRQLLTQQTVIRTPQGQPVMQQPQYVIQHASGMGVMRFAQPIGIGNNVIVKNSAATGTTITLDQIRAGFAPQRLDGTQPSVILVKPPTGQSSNLPQLEGSADFQDVPSSSTTAKIISQLVITKDRKGKSARKIPQLDGPSGLSDDESDDEFVDDDPAPMTDTIDDDEEEEDLALDDKDVQEEGQPLGPEDDISDEEDPDDMFEAENVVVCQYEKINRTKNKWKLVLKDGIMSLNGKDYVFQKATGEAEW